MLTAHGPWNNDFERRSNYFFFPDLNFKDTGGQYPISVLTLPHEAPPRRFVYRQNGCPRCAIPHPRCRYLLKLRQLRLMVYLRTSRVNALLHLPFESVRDSNPTGGHRNAFSILGGSALDNTFA